MPRVQKVTESVDKTEHRATIEVNGRLIYERVFRASEFGDNLRAKSEADFRMTEQLNRLDHSTMQLPRVKAAYIDAMEADVKGLRSLPLWELWHGLWREGMAR